MTAITEARVRELAMRLCAAWCSEFLGNHDVDPDLAIIRRKVRSAGQAPGPFWRAMALVVLHGVAEDEKRLDAEGR